MTISVTIEDQKCIENLDIDLQNQTLTIKEYNNMKIDKCLNVCYHCIQVARLL